MCADEVIGYTAADSSKAIQDGVDVALDPLGADYSPRSLTLLPPGGIDSKASCRNRRSMSLQPTVMLSVANQRAQSQR
ncbi:MAG: hypothetical protein JWP48_3186 [Actinoallomurus sp.]|nr:hypothetical protein [Actinoallomurus sp.]